MSEDKSGLQHDVFARKVFSKRKNVIDFVRNVLPKRYCDKLDFDSIQLSKESFISNKYVSKQLGNFYSDMVINMKLNGLDTKCAVLIEHKAQYDKFTIAQIHKYLASLWNEEILNNPTNLTPIIPILLYHGKTKWNKDNNMEMCFNKNLDDDFKRFIPKLEYIIFDLNNVKDEELKGNIEYLIAMRILKHIFTDILLELKKVLIDIENYVSKHELDNELKDFLEDLITYINKSEGIEPDNIDELVSRISNNELKEVIMTLENKLELRGIEKGIEKGRMEEKMETAKNLKCLGISIDKISKATGLTIEEIEKL